MANIFQYDLHQLAVGVLYLNLGRAGLEFPTTTRAHPSYQVQVTLIPPGTVLEGGHRALFPFLVRWDIWQQVVVPLFADGSVLVKVGAEKNETLRQWINKSYLLTGDYQPLLDKIKQALRLGYEAQGFVPVGTGDDGFVAAPSVPGEPGPPVQPNGSPYQQFD